MTTETETRTITPIQFRRAQALARAHGHEWGSARVAVNGEPDPLPGDTEVELTLLASAEDVSAAIESAFADRIGMSGLSFATGHTTGSGRLEWNVGADGAVELVVWRPGSTLAALRRLHTDRHSLLAAGGFGASLGALIGDGYVGPLADAMREQRQGVVVLSAWCGPDGSVALTEMTRWDVADDADAAELRHWATLRDALRVLGAELPADTRSEVVAALADQDAACAEASAGADGPDADTLHAAARVACERSILPGTGAAHVVETARRRGAGLPRREAQ